MRYLSTNKTVKEQSFRAAVLQGLASDNGLFLPASIPVLPKSFFDKLSSCSFQDLSFAAAQALIGDELDPAVLRSIIHKALNFNAPLQQIAPDLFVLELFHGPTLAFKDFGARFMAQLTSHYLAESPRKLYVLVATSGDTGSAVANGFFNLPNIEVVLLYPSGKVSRVQEMQLTTLGGNITALEVDGTFDDCQKLVKQAFLDSDLTAELLLSSANSINIARLIPQSFYYFYAYAQLPDKTKPVVFSVPSGNFGNLTAGLLAKRMGLPVSKFVAATNVNDIVPSYLRTGRFAPAPSKQTLSNAMDVGNPSNFARMRELYGDDVERMRGEIYGCHFTDAETCGAMRDVYRRWRYVCDPHGAVAYLGLSEYAPKADGPVSGIFLETAHPAKFYETVEKELGISVELPQSLAKCLALDKVSVPMTKDYDDFKRFLQQKAG